MTAGSNTYEYVAGKPLPVNSAPINISYGYYRVPPKVQDMYGELLERINQSAYIPAKEIEEV